MKGIVMKGVALLNPIPPVEQLLKPWLFAVYRVLPRYIIS